MLWILLFAALLLLKLFGILVISWWIVALPLVIPLVLFLVAGCGVLMLLSYLDGNRSVQPFLQ